MDSELKQKWVEALRSGEYKQGRKALRDKGNCWCCLGVLCDVSGMGHWIEDKYFDWDYAVGDQMRCDFLPPALGDKVGLDSVAQTQLTRLNDEAGMSFPEIADYIEKNL